MSHKKVDSQGNIPFSWEQKPGISKLITTKKVLDDNDEQSPRILSNNGTITKGNKNQTPLPPAFSSKPPSRIGSGKGQLIVQDQEDPFLVALKECTKPTSINGKFQLCLNINNDHNHKINSEQGSSRPNKMKSMFGMYFSCKSMRSCDVIITTNNNDKNYVKRSNSKLPDLPRYKFQDFMMEKW